MQATRILPDLQCSLVCEEVRQEANGNLFLIGVVNVIRVPQIPIVAGRICIFNRWTAGIGQFNENTRLIAPDQTTVVSKGEMKFELKDPSHSATGVMVFGNVKFDTAGTYYIEVMVEDVMKLRYPLVVAHVPQAGQPAAQPPQA
ncbi:MAG: hypothetical protein JF609_09115 [Verrucomicrobia bacterium]|nr:hypothetical protein [Verrucomicrobiota bacterium]